MEVTPAAKRVGSKGQRRPGGGEGGGALAQSAGCSGRSFGHALDSIRKRQLRRTTNGQSAPKSAGRTASKPCKEQGARWTEAGRQDKMEAKCEGEKKGGKPKENEGQMPTASGRARVEIAVGCAHMQRRYGGRKPEKTRQARPCLDTPRRKVQTITLVVASLDSQSGSIRREAKPTSLSLFLSFSLVLLPPVSP